MRAQFFSFMLPLAWVGSDYEDNLTKIHIRLTMPSQMQTQQKSDAIYVDNKTIRWREMLSKMCSYWNIYSNVDLLAGGFVSMWWVKQGWIHNSTLKYQGFYSS